jgi:ribosomal protein S27AE
MERVDALVFIKEKAQRKQAFLEKFRKGFQMSNRISAEEKEWNAEFTSKLRGKFALSQGALAKRFDAEIVPAVNEELAAAAYNVQMAIDSSPALRLIPQNYRNTPALSTMVGYLENGRAGSWVECLDKLEQGGARSTGPSSVKCPKCGSTNLQVTTQTDQSGGFDAGKAACGAFLLGPLGLLCGSNKKVVTHTDFWVCGSCGNKFPREGQR